jgi:hypothetical protein
LVETYEKPALSTAVKTRWLAAGSHGQAFRLRGAKKTGIGGDKHQVIAGSMQNTRHIQRRA